MFTRVCSGTFYLKGINVHCCVENDYSLRAVGGVSKGACAHLSLLCHQLRLYSGLVPL